MTAIDRQVAPAERFADARSISAGACNPTAISGALHRHCLAMLKAGADTPTILADPALRLIAHQLAFLFKVADLDEDLTAYARALDACNVAA
jgi:hypothetical protein